MAALPDPRREAFARALAMGLSWIAASADAGYAGNRKLARERAAAPEIVARVKALRDEPAWDETSDLAGVINALLRLARKAGDMPTAAAMAAARGLLAEAAKLKSGLRDTAGTSHGAPPVDPRYAPLSDEDWIAKHVPRG